MDLSSFIRDIPDFPKPGVAFKDITPLLRDAVAFREAIVQMADGFADVDVAVGIDARGFILAGAVANQLGIGLVPVRKGGKLPWEIEAVTYTLEYGEERLEMHVDGLEPGQRALIVDDVLATGGTAVACADLVRRVGGTVAAYTFLIELGFLGGRGRLGDTHARALVRY